MELDLIRDIVQGIVEELDGIKGKGERTDYDAGQTVGLHGSTVYHSKHMRRR